MLTRTQTQNLHALTDCIIPADDYPSGWDAGVGAYLAQFLTREPQFLFTYQAGLDAVHAGGFLNMSADAQSEYLTALEHAPESGAFFRLLIAHVQEGFYADPGNGGNKDAVAWQMIGFTVTA